MGRFTVEHGSDGESWGCAPRLIQPAIRIQGGSGPPDGCPLRKAIVSDSSGSRGPSGSHPSSMRAKLLVRKEGTDLKIIKNLAGLHKNQKNQVESVFWFAENRPVEIKKFKI
jgi:hypothetical protein